MSFIYNFEDDVFNSPQQTLANREAQMGYYSWLTRLPDPDPILIAQGTDISVYRDLKIDSHLSAVLTKRKTGVESMEWEIKGNGASKRVVKFFENLFNELELPDIMTKILDCVYFGYQPFLINWDLKDGMRIPRLEDRPPDYFFFDTSNKLRIRTKDSMGVEADPRIFINAVYNGDYLNPYGDRIAKKVFWPVTFKRGGMKFWLKMNEKYGMPFAIGKVSKNSDKKTRMELASMLHNMVQDAVAVINDDESIDLKEAGGKSASSQLYKDFMNFLNYEISKAVLTVVNTVEMGDSGSYAASETQFHGEGKLNVSDTKLIIKFFNKLIRLTTDINFGPLAIAPKFSQYEAEDIDKNLAERDNILTQQGVKFTKEYYKKNYNLQDGDFEILAPETPIVGAGGEGLLSAVVPAEAGEEAGGAAPSAQLASLNLNGAQIASAVAIVENVSKGDIPRDAGLNQLKVFLGLNNEQAEAVMGDSGKGATIKADKVVVNGKVQPPSGDEAFSEETSRKKIEELMEAVPGDLLQMQIEKTLKPVIDMITDGKSFNEINEKLSEIFPDMSTDKIEGLLEKVMLTAHILGRADA